MPKKGVVLNIGQAGDFDDSGLGSPSCLFINNCFYLYYHASNGSNNRIGLAISKDGINFVKKGVVLILGTAGEIDVSESAYPCIFYHNNYFYLYYSGGNAGGNMICLAISKDGINFIKKGIVVGLGQAGESDDVVIYSSSVLYFNDYFYNYYTSYNGSNFRTNLAISKDGINFVKKGVVLILGTAGDVDDSRAYFGSVILYNNLFYLLYSARDGSTNKIAFAVSKNGFNFTKKGIILPLGQAGEFDDVSLQMISFLFINNNFYIYYIGNSGVQINIGLAITKNCINFS